MQRTLLIAILAAQANPASAQGARTQDYVNRVLGIGNEVEYPPFSAERIGTPQYRRCIASDPSNAHASWCLDAEYKRQDARVTKVFSDRLKSASAEDRPLLQRAQLAWRRFRAANCEVRANSGGSGAGLFYSGCLIRETNQRIAEILGNWDY